MTQVELEREICRSTGESLSRIRRLGFSLETPADDSADPEPIAAPNVIDWDEHYRAERPCRHHRPAAQDGGLASRS
jgi:hypothetical protein